jgi:glycerol-3-phosphate acyltransferase PlsY
MSIILLICGYIFGSIPFALVISKLKGVNILKVGTHNPGAANVYREVGKKYGIMVWGLDTIKGVIPMIVAGILKQPLIVVSAVGAAAIVGHCFSLFLKFKGGKGVATMGGVVLYLFPLLFPVGAVLYFWVQKMKRKPSIIFLGFLIFFCGSIYLL